MSPNVFEKVSTAVNAVPRKVKFLVGLVVVLVVAAVVVPLALMASPKFMSGLNGFDDNYTTLQSSKHAGLSCNDCHVDERGSVVHAVAATGEFYRSLVAGDEETEFLEMGKPSPESCRRCHEEDWSYESDRTAKVPHPAHLRVATETRDCVGCHKWTGHLEDYLEEHKTMPFSGVCSTYGCHAGWKPEGSCDQCHHTLREKPEQWRAEHAEVVVNTGDGGCLESCHEIKQCQQCHTTGESPFKQGIQAKTERDRLETLHAAADWIRRHGSESLDDQTQCLSCHISVGECQSCHSRRPASHGAEDTWIGTHKNSVKSENQCVTCHEKPWCDECHDQFKEMR